MKYFLILLFLMTTQAKAALFAVVQDTKHSVIIEMNGPIEYDDYKKLMEIMTPYYRRRRVAISLQSRGGSMYGSLQIGRTIRRLGIITVIRANSTCNSGCALIFFAGWDRQNRVPYRIKSPKSRLGLHQPSTKVDGTTRVSGRDTFENLKIYLDQMGVDEEIFDLMKKTHFREIAYIKDSTLRRMDGFKVESTQAIRHIKFPGDLTAWNNSALYAKKTYSNQIRRGVSGN